MQILSHDLSLKSETHDATNRCDTSPRQVFCNTSPRVTCENHCRCDRICRCDLSHEFKLVWIRATNRSDKTRASDLLQQQCRRGDLSQQRVAAICRIVCLGLCNCMWRFGFKALMKSFSCTKPSNLFLHFLSTSKRFSRSWGIVPCIVSRLTMSRARSCSVWQWRRIVVYALLHDYANAACVTYISEQHTADLQLVVFFLFSAHSVD